MLRRDNPYTPNAGAKPPALVGRDSELEVFLLDEAQFLRQEDLEAIIAGLHRTVQDQLPITLVGAGLPQLPRLAAEAKSYAERLFRFPTLGRLEKDEAARALIEPAQELDVTFEDAAVEAIVKYTEGYPYFIQEYGQVVWDLATDSPITLADVNAAQDAVEAILDSNFFRVRTERTTNLELQYLKALAQHGPNPQRTMTVAKTLGTTSDKLGQTRFRLIEKGLLYSPGHGLAAFTVPQFDRYMRRIYALENEESGLSHK